MQPKLTERLESAPPRRAALPAHSQALVLLFAVTVGVATGPLSVPLLRRIPNDLQRTRAILGGLKSHNPAVVVFGDSVIMNGIDAGAISSQLPGSPEVLNLSSTGQTLAESYLYYQELPQSVRAVVQAVRVPYLFSRDSDSELRSNVADTFLLYGYRPSVHTLEFLARQYGRKYSQQLEASSAALAFRSRWLIRQWLDTTMRRVMRKDLNLAHAMEDLSYPAPYRGKLSDETIALRLRAYEKSHVLVGDTLVEDKLRNVLETKRDCEQRGFQFVLLITPVHPALAQPAATRNLENSLKSGVLGRPREVLNASDLLTRDQFYDEEHPTSVGARILTATVAKALGQE
jgi:hypothetical protein